MKPRTLMAAVVISVMNYPPSSLFPAFTCNRKHWFESDLFTQRLSYAYNTARRTTEDITVLPWINVWPLSYACPNGEETVTHSACLWSSNGKNSHRIILDDRPRSIAFLWQCKFPAKNMAFPSTLNSAWKVSRYDGFLSASGANYWLIPQVFSSAIRNRTKLTSSEF